MSPVNWLVCTLLISCSAYLSASETALFTLSRFQLRFLKENFKSVYRKIKKLLADPGGLLITILVVNELLNITLATLVARSVSESHYPIPKILGNLDRGVFEIALGILVTAPTVLFLCEITPKVIGARANKLVATLTVGPLTVVYQFFTPVRYVLKHAIRLLSAPQSIFSRDLKDKAKRSEADGILKGSDFLLLVEEGHKEGAIQENEFELIRNVFELDNTSVAEVATPLSQLYSMSIQTSIKDALTAVRVRQYSRIPVVSPNKKEVVGILYAKDLLRSKLHPGAALETVASVMRKPYFVNDQLKLNALFRKFKQHRIHMAIVKNILGEVTGVVTMSNVLDALFEDILTDEIHADRLSKASPAHPQNSHRGKL